MKPTVSIIITLYNAEATLDRCLESVLTQSLREIEVLCVDDGSTDGSAEKLRQWRERDSRVRIESFEENKGIVPAANLALRESTGDYMMFLDADDRLLPGACENAVGLIRKHDVDILQFGVKVNAPSAADEAVWQKNLASNERTSEGVNILYDCYSMHRIRHNIWNKIYRGGLCRKAGAAMPDLRISQAADVLQTFFFLYFAKTFRSVPDGPIYEYSVGNGISTHAPTAEQFASLCEASMILPAIEEFLKREEALEPHRFLLESIGIVLKSDVVNRLLALPEITKETLDLAVKSWGSGILYDFIEATGLLDVECNSRHKLIPMLVKRFRKQQNEPPPASPRSINISIST